MVSYNRSVEANIHMEERILRYFTKEWYNEMQVYGFLAFPDSKEDWEESVRYYLEEGIDYKKNAKEDLESRKGDLLKFLPESFHPYILNGTINSEFPSPELRNMAEQWLMEYDERMEKSRKEYKDHYESIKSQLPKSVVQLQENSLHDATIKSIESPSHETLIMILDCSGGFHYFTDIKLTFTGVRSLSMPEEIEGAYWLYDEVYLSDKHFELHVLLDCPLTEYSIIAENVIIEQL